MARHTDANNNIWYDGVTLTNCTYVHCKDGCTGTVKDCNYIEIGENNTGLTLDNVNYCTVGNNNATVDIGNSDYIIVGSECENIKIGSHSSGNTRFTGRTGGNSLVIGHKIIGAEITGWNSKYDKSRNIQADGTFNQVTKSGVVFLDDANGNELNNSSRIDLKQTNNNSVETKNINLTNKAPFIDYALIDDVTRVQSRVPVVNRQADANGTILDRSLNRLINAPKGESPKGDAVTTDKYTLQNGVFVKVL
jgi:spore germination protein GerM